MREIEIESFLEEKEIYWLCHFTRAENLKSIFSNGLVSRDKIDNKSIEGIINDNYRFDNCTNANCMSVEFPNYKMFYQLRCDNPQTKWAILLFNIELINHFKCAFCYTNAGSREIYSVPIEDRIGVEAFKGIFIERDIYPMRKSLNIPNYFPTNPQAEVLVFGDIPCTRIEYVFFFDDITLAEFAHTIPPNISASVNRYYFYGRCDYEYWR